ncbi:MAG: S24 family peptidase [Candidatus Saccharibacteria bacterium]|nr:S24 family peptidase [Candidatus Saccharibacteria bacterium]
MKKLPARACVIVKDDSLRPLLEPGDVVMIDTTVPLYNGCMAVIEIDGAMVMRQYLRRDDGSIFRSLNPSISDISFAGGISIIGVVTNVIRGR